MTEPWRTAIVQTSPTGHRIRGYEVTSLMQGTFTDAIFLLHRGRLPNPAERLLLDAILVGVADWGAGAPSCAAARLAASGNRQSISAAVGAGVLAIGNEHGGAGEQCMQLIAEAVAAARGESISFETCAVRAVVRAQREHTRLPGLGHRTLTIDPRVKVLFDMAREHGVAGDGIAFVTALEAAARERIKPLPLNIDGALAAVLYDLGFDARAGKFIFIIGRVAGITAEVAEEYAREKPMRITVPVDYDGEPPRTLD